MRRFGLILLVLLLLLPLLPAGCGAEEPPIPATCNGHEALCARRVDEVSFPTTHNAMSTVEDEFVAPNQRYRLDRQLADGVRAMMLDVWDEEGVPTLCHQICDLGEVPLLEGLQMIDRFLDRNRGEVVAILFEDHVPPSAIEPVLRESGLFARVRPQAVGDPWPTLRELIDADERLIVMAENEGGLSPWYLDMWSFVWDTPYTFNDPSEFTCAPNRGDPQNSLFLVNHWLSGLDREAQAEVAAPLLRDRVRQCMTESGRLPNFVGVDHYHVGELFTVVGELNGL